MRKLIAASALLLIVPLIGGCGKAPDPKATPTAAQTADMEAGKQKLMQQMQQDPKLNPATATNPSATTGPVPGGAGMQTIPAGGRMPMIGQPPR